MEKDKINKRTEMTKLLQVNFNLFKIIYLKILLKFKKIFQESEEQARNDNMDFSDVIGPIN